MRLALLSVQVLYDIWLDMCNRHPRTFAHEPRKEVIRTEDMVRAALQEDILMIEIIEEIGSKLGKGIAGLINIFNPQLVVIGGVVSGVGDYLILPIQSAIKKYSLNLVNKDTTVRCSQLNDSAGIIGACFIARNRVLGIL